MVIMTHNVTLRYKKIKKPKQYKYMFNKECRKENRVTKMAEEGSNVRGKTSKLETIGQKRGKNIAQLRKDRGKFKKLNSRNGAKKEEEGTVVRELPMLFQFHPAFSKHYSYNPRSV